MRGGRDSLDVDWRSQLNRGQRNECGSCCLYRNFADLEMQSTISSAQERAEVKNTNGASARNEEKGVSYISPRSRNFASPFYCTPPLTTLAPSEKDNPLP